MSEKIDKAMELFKERKYSEAIDAFHLVLETEPDNADVYNNLGVVAYYMQSYLPANGYFKLAYEIYKSTMGLTHPRTLMIQSNLTKMKQLNFNKEIEFKTLSKYPTPAQVMANKKKKGKK